jgi:hypothetical protein
VSERWTQERPPWCPHPTCQFVGTQAQGSLCIGELPTPEPHDGDVNTHRWCIHGAKDDGEWTFDLQINQTDVWWMRRLFDRVFPQASAT